MCSIGYAMMNVEEGKMIATLEHIRYRCLSLTTDRFGTGNVYYKVYAVLGLARSYRFDQISDCYSDRKMMQSLADIGRGELIVHAPSEVHPPIPSHGSSGPLSGLEPIVGPLLIYVWRSDYDRIVAANQHHGHHFVVFEPPTDEEWEKYRLTPEEWKKCEKEFYHIDDDE